MKIKTMVRRIPHLALSLSFILGGTVAMENLAVAGPLYTTAPQCKVAIKRGPKMGRCIACVKTGGTFDAQGAAVGVCIAPPPPKPASVVAPVGCNTHVAIPAKRKACLACVKSGGTFFIAGANCVLPPPPGISTIPGCKTKLAIPAKQKLCIMCVKSGGSYTKWEKGGVGKCHR